MALVGQSGHAPIALGNMRANGVRTIAASCSARDCHGAGVVEVERLGDDVPVPSLGARMRCSRCGNLGADARPNWQERAPDRLFGPRAT